MEKRILTCLRSGGDFRPSHVQAMARQIERWAPNARFQVLSDVDVPGVERIPLKYDWPNWWAKLEMYRPDVPGNFLFTDLDNVFLGPLDDILAIDEFTTQIGQSNALTYLTDDVRAIVWEKFAADPAHYMTMWSPQVRRMSTKPWAFGDGGFLASVVQTKSFWEERVPGHVVNIAELGVRAKGMFRPLDIPKTARIVLCYRPWRPWTLPVFKKLYE